MISRFLPLVAAAIVALPLFSVFGASLPQRPAAVLGVDYIRTTQQPDGGFGGFGPGQSMDAIFAIRAAGIDPNTVVTNGNNPADYLESVAAEATDAGSAAKAALAARALGLDPRDVAGTDLVAVVNAAYDPETGGYTEDAFTHSLAVVSLSYLGLPAPNGAVTFLRDAQVGDGGWGFGGASDADTTALGLQALIAAGLPPSDPAVAAAIAYLRDTQAEDGGWGYDPSASNTSSTAFAVQALIAAGEDPTTYEVAGVDPIDYLLAAQNPDGSFPGFDPAFATNQVVPALAGRTYGGAVDTPILPPPSPRQVAPGPPATGTGTGIAPAHGSVPAWALPLAAAVLAFGGAAALRRSA